MRSTAAACSPRRGSGAATTTASATAGRAEQDLFDFQRADVFAAANDDVGLAVGDGEVAVVVDDPDVAGVVPAVVVERPRGQRRVGIAEEQIRSATEYFAVVGQPDLYPWPRIRRRCNSRLSSGAVKCEPVIDGCSLLP